MQNTLAPTPKKHAKGARRREQILDVSLELFRTVGYRATSLRDIAAAAGLTHQGMRRYFAGTEDILGSLVERFEHANLEWMDERARQGLPSGPVELARRNAEIPGYVELYAALVGEATSAHHPAHDAMREHYRFARRMPLVDFRDQPDPWSDAVRLVAGWDGLQLMSLYADDIDLPNRLARRIAFMHDDDAPALTVVSAAVSTVEGAPSSASGTSVLPAGGPGTDAEAEAEAEPRGYAPGRERRERIIADATTLFSRHGFHDTSLQDIASAVGIAKSTLLHHVSSKEELLIAVLQRRDDRVSARSPQELASAAGGDVDMLVAQAGSSSADDPGLIAIYSVLSCEAIAPEHPAHEFFRTRFAHVRAAFTEVFTRLIAEGRVPADRDPREEADWLVALWDGLQYQWLYEPELIDVAALLRDHFDDLERAVANPPR
ncbi:TetR/AcrR family transcriptional regulator [Plantibacter sp. YIM 135347]|uniref:TetR/AcrR family transcriptional regulator n=1 Tax=Plantibacter sp. YIM 135347 TaxID=3423919 RepID=UPI003D346D93